MNLQLEFELLQNKKIRHLFIYDSYYFYTEDIVENYPDLKIDTDQILFSGETPLVKAKDIHAMTAFDQLITKNLLQPKKNNKKDKK